MEGVVEGVVADIVAGLVAGVVAVITRPAAVAVGAGVNEAILRYSLKLGAREITLSARVACVSAEF